MNGQRIRAHGAADQRQDFLADLGAPDLEHGAFRAGHTATGHGGDHAQVGGLHVFQVDLDLGQAGGKQRVLDQGLAFLYTLGWPMTLSFSSAATEKPTPAMLVRS